MKLLNIKKGREIKMILKHEAKGKIKCGLAAFIIVCGGLGIARVRNDNATGCYISHVQAEESVYKITDEKTFVSIMTMLSGTNKATYSKITLEADIILTGDSDYSIKPKLESTVVFDGKGHSISGINTESVNGLFAENKGTIRNLIIRDSGFTKDIKKAYISSNMVSDPTTYLGGLVSYNTGTISNCHMVNVSVTQNGYFAGGVGGIAGCNDRGYIRNCTFAGTVTGNNSHVGGIVGESGSLVHGYIENCANFGEIISNMDSSHPNGGLLRGGICGTGYVINNCYNVGNINGSAIAGGVYGNCSHLYSTSDVNVGGGTGTVTESFVGLTDEYMRSAEFANALNNNVGDNKYWLSWEYISGTYPMPAQSMCSINVEKSEITTAYASKNIGLGYTCTGISNSDVTVVSSKKSVATVNSNGTIYIVGPGVTTVTLSFDGNDKFKPAESKTITVKVTPAKVKGVKVKKIRAKKIKVTWKSVVCSGYAVQYSTDKKFKKNLKTVNAKSTVTKKNISKLKKGKTYYVRVVAYTGQGSEKLISVSSAVKKIKMK